ncbi:hypothetical protein LINGRAHAP2_LOCUS5050 [Linum grandiflorum]
MVSLLSRTPEDRSASISGHAAGVRPGNSVASSSRVKPVDGDGATGRSWATVVGTPTSDLKFYEIPESALVNGVLAIPQEIVDVGLKRLQSALVAQFIGPLPPARVIAAMANRLWGYEGFFLFEFPSVQLSEWVIARAWHIHHSGIQPLDLEVTEVPTWITLKGVPPQLITNEGVGWLVSRWGKPLNKLVRDGVNVKVCLLMDRNSCCPDSVNIQLDGATIIIPVEIATARQYGADIPRREIVRQQWIAKTQPTALLKDSSSVGDKPKSPMREEGLPTPTRPSKAGGGGVALTKSPPGEKVLPTTQQVGSSQAASAAEGRHLNPGRADDGEMVAIGMAEQVLEAIVESDSEEVDEEIVVDTPQPRPDSPHIIPGTATLGDFLSAAKPTPRRPRRKKGRRR